MLYSEKQLMNSRLAASDGELGRLDELYFDDKDWRVRYLVADIGGWLSGRRILLSPDVAGKPDPVNTTVPINLTRERIQQSPPTDFDRPIDDTHQRDLALHYGWAAYWGPGMNTTTPFMFMPLFPVDTIDDEEFAAAPKDEVLRPQAVHAATIEGAHLPPPENSDVDGNIHLRSSRALRRYELSTMDGEHFGQVTDLVLEYPDWRVRYLVGDTRRWLPGREVLLSPTWIRSMDWHDQQLHLGITRRQVETAPSYTPEQLITRQDEVELFQHFSRSGYWSFL